MMPAPSAYRVGVRVQHEQAAPSGPVGTVTRLLKPSVGVPHMVRVEWPTSRGGTHSAPVPARALRVVSDS